MRPIAVSMMLLILAACTKIDYIGEEYPPTTHVNLYFAEADVPYNYTIMGRLVATADDFISAQKMQKRIMEEARKRGADGVVILGLERYQAGESDTYKETTETEETTDGAKTATIVTRETDIEKEKEIRALFIKYR